MKRSSSFTASRRGVLAASTVAALGAAMVAVPLFAVSASAHDSDNKSGGQKVTICHRTNDAKKPYVQETVDIASSGLVKSGHNDHTGDVFSPGMKDDHEKWGDIIPAYTYKISEHKTFTFKGLNWDGAGQEIWKNDCKVVVPTPSDTETTPAVDPSPEESSPATDPSPEESSPATDPSPEESSPATDPSPEESSPATDPSGDASNPATDPSPEESSPATDPSPEESSPATDPSPEESSPATDPSPEESSPATDPSPEDSSPSDPGNTGDPQGSGDPTPEPSTSDPSGAGTPSDGSSEEPVLPSTGGNGTTLPQTGSDSAAMIALAAGLVAMGTVSIVVARRRTELDAS